jgi:two-component sensor histidine kinase
MAAILLIVSLTYGNVGAEYFYFSMFILTFYIFRNRFILGGLLVYLITLFTIAKLFQHTVVLQGKDAAIAPYIYTADIVLSFLAAAYFLGLFILEHESYMREVEEKNELLQHALNDANDKKEEIKVLLGELNHRTKNNLQLVSSLINNQANKLTDETAKKALLDGKNRIISIALIHKKLYQNEYFTTVSFKDYVDDLISHLVDVFDDRSNPAEIYKDIEDFNINIDNAVTLGLIINELLTNSFKHGLTGAVSRQIRIKIHCISDNDLDIIISDSGTGIEKMFNEKDSETFGLGLILSLVKQMDGTIINDVKGSNSIHLSLKYNLQ